jgi:hypothetical protein
MTDPLQPFIDLESERGLFGSGEDLVRSLAADAIDQRRRGEFPDPDKTGLTLLRDSIDWRHARENHTPR